MLEELDGARLDGAYAGNRLKRYWLCPLQKAVEVDKLNETDMPDEPDDDGSGRWPLPEYGIFVRIP